METNTATLATVILRPGEADRVIAGHPWIYGGSVLKLTRPVENGAVVQVQDHRQRFLGIGIYNAKSKINVRLIANVRVPVDNILLGEGRGFEIAQGRLGPGRIHHCMRVIGAAQRALETACKRVNSRVVFGKKLSEQGSVRESIALMASKVEMCRLLTLRAADKMDRLGNKAAMDLIAMAKIMVPQLGAEVIDMAIQMHGAGGLTDDYFLAEAFNYARWCRIADGPDQVHMMALGKQVIRELSA